MTKNDSWLKKDVVATRLGCSELEVERLVQLGKLTRARVQKKDLYDPDDVEQLSEEQETLRRNTVFSTAEDLYESIESIGFINKPWLPKGLVTILVASPGLGKSMLALDVTRRLLNPELGWFDDQPLDVPPGGRVIWCEAEAFHAGLMERINALGIPKDRFILPFKHALEDVRLDDNQHREQLERVIKVLKPSLVVVDSLRGSHSKDENDSRDMTEILSFLSRLARDYNIAILVIHHVRKPGPGEPDIISLNRQRGSSATAYLARTVWALDKPNPATDLLRLQVIKSNVARKPDPLGLKATNRGIEWTKEVPEQPRNKTKEEAAMEFLQEALKGGPRLQKELDEEADQEGISKSALRRASKRLSVIKEKRKGDGLWEWELLRGKSKRGVSLKPSDATSDDAD